MLVPTRDNALHDQRLGATIGGQGVRPAALAARLGDHGRSRRRARSAAAGFGLFWQLVCLPRPLLPSPLLPSYVSLAAPSLARNRVLTRGLLVLAAVRARRTQHHLRRRPHRRRLLHPHRLPPPSPSPPSPPRPRRLRRRCALRHRHHHHLQPRPHLPRPRRRHP